MKEMERWEKEAARVREPSDKTILDAARLYVLLRSLVEKERPGGDRERLPEFFVQRQTSAAASVPCIYETAG